MKGGCAGGKKNNNNKLERSVSVRERKREDKSRSDQKVERKRK